MSVLVPEFAVSDIVRSLKFYVDILGFQIKYQRREEGFAYIYLGEAELMLDQLNLGRDFDIGENPPQYPFGHGLNVQIKVEKLAPMLDALKNHGLSLYLPLEEKTYRINDVKVGQKQFVIADPDGYLLRFYESIETT